MGYAFKQNGSYRAVAKNTELESDEEYAEELPSYILELIAEQETILVAQAEISRLRKIADDAIAPLRDAVELGRADQAKQDLLIAWKNYRLDLMEVVDQPGYPATINWPTSPE